MKTVVELGSPCLSQLQPEQLPGPRARILQGRAADGGTPNARSNFFLCRHRCSQRYPGSVGVARQTYKNVCQYGIGHPRIAYRLQKAEFHLDRIRSNWGIAVSDHDQFGRTRLSNCLVNPLQVRDLPKRLDDCQKMDQIDANVVADFAGKIQPEPRNYPMSSLVGQQPD